VAYEEWCTDPALQLQQQRKKVRVVQPIGKRETLISMVVALLLCGVHLIFYPLLVLTADQVAIFAQCSDKYRTVVVVILDDQAASLVSFLDQVVRLVLDLSIHTSTMVFHCGSPKFLATKPKFTHKMIECRKSGLLLSVILGDVNLLSKQAASLRVVIRKVGLTILQPLLPKQKSPTVQPFHVQLIATLSADSK
jgi:hypothetical protein